MLGTLCSWFHSQIRRMMSHKKPGRVIGPVKSCLLPKSCLSQRQQAPRIRKSRVDQHRARALIEKKIITGWDHFKSSKNCSCEWLTYHVVALCCSVIFYKLFHLSFVHDSRSEDEGRNLNQFFCEEKRLRTFRGWPLDFIHSVDLAKAGFIYSGINDCVRCVFCL